MIEWTLRTRLPEMGLVSVKGRIVGDDIIFDHPTEEGEILLKVSIMRAEEIATWPGYRRAKLNMTIERKLIHVGKEFERDEYRPVLPFVYCVYCKAIVTVIDEDFYLHALPWCKRWTQSDGMNKPDVVFKTQAMKGE